MATMPPPASKRRKLSGASDHENPANPDASPRASHENPRKIAKVSATWSSRAAQPHDDGATDTEPATFEAAMEALNRVFAAFVAAQRALHPHGDFSQAAQEYIDYVVALRRKFASALVEAPALLPPEPLIAATTQRETEKSASLPRRADTTTSDGDDEEEEEEEEDAVGFESSASLPPLSSDTTAPSGFSFVTRESGSPRGSSTSVSFPGFGFSSSSATPASSAFSYSTPQSAPATAPSVAPVSFPGFGFSSSSAAAAPSTSVPSAAPTSSAGFGFSSSSAAFAAPAAKPPASAASAASTAFGFSSSSSTYSSSAFSFGIPSSSSTFEAFGASSSFAAPASSPFQGFLASANTYGSSSIWTDPELLRLKADASSIQRECAVYSSPQSEVWRGVWKGMTPVALKRLAPPRQDMANALVFATNVKAVAALQHPRIVALLGVEWTKAPELQVATEFMPRSDLRSLLDGDLAVSLTWDNFKCQVAIDVVDALAFLHAQSHASPMLRLSSSRKVLLSDDARAKLNVIQGSDVAQQRRSHAVRYMAPEVITGGSVSSATDMYALGVLLCELDTTRAPYADVVSPDGAKMEDELVAQQVVKGVLMPTVSPQCSETIARLVAQCTMYDAAQRPTAAAVTYALRELLKNEL